MGLTLEFMDPTVTREEILKLAEEKRIPYTERFHEIQEMPNGNVSIFVKNVSFPGLRRKAFGKREIPKELDVLYTLRMDILKGSYQPPEGMYAYGKEGIDSFCVQRVKDVQLGEVKTSVEIVGTDLDKIDQAYLHLRSGKLKPSQEFSSPGSIEAPKADEPDTKEGSGQHPLPQPAATPQAA